MTAPVLPLLLLLGSFVAGLLGSLTGLGGGVVIVPLLLLAFKVNIRYAMGASLISVIATSSGAAAAYTREGYSNIRIGMFLEMATTLGAIAGASIAVHAPATVIAVIFGAVLISSAVFAIRQQHDSSADSRPDPLATRLKMNSTYPTSSGPQSYLVRRVPGGFALMFVAGALSGLLGIGSGALKVLAMDQAMRVPFKVSTTTSNFMIGVTAAASAGIVLRSGFIAPALAMPVVLGVLAGSVLGTRVLVRAQPRGIADRRGPGDRRSGYRDDLRRAYGEVLARSNGGTMKASVSSKPWTNEQVEQAVGRLLQTGVLLSSAIVLIGGILYLMQHGGGLANYGTFNASGDALRAIWPVLQGAAHLDGRSVIELGLLVLIATPVARVAFAVVAFWLQRDHIYVDGQRHCPGDSAVQFAGLALVRQVPG